MASPVDSIINAESGNNPNASNPNSSASGAGQFIDSTWVDTLSKHRPDLVEGKSRDEILSMKSDPQLSRDMTGAYAADNAAILSKAGLPVTDGSVYLSHFAGPQGAVKVMQADPNAPVGDILGAGVVKANPFLQGMTAQGLQAWAAKKMGATSPIPSAAPVNSPSPAIAPPQGQPPIFAAPPVAQPQQQEAAQAPDQSLLAQMQPMQFQFARPHQVDLTKLRAQLQRAPIFAKA